MNNCISIFEEQPEIAGNALTRFCDAYPYIALFGISLCGSLLTLTASYFISDGPAIVREVISRVHELVG